jgi:glycosyltransferase involved in cell wall biosynthesis
MKRKVIVLNYNYDENWIGGAYYIQNLVIAFNKLIDEEKPKLYLVSTPEEFRDFVEITKYPYIDHSSKLTQPKYNIIERGINKISRTVNKRNAINKEPYDLIFPVYSLNIEDNFERKLFWIPDFQEHYFPDLFSIEEIGRRKKVQENISKLPVNLLLSSKAALADFKKLYPNSRSENHIVPFAVSHPNYRDLSIKNIKAKYGIGREYFISSNQFWAHKNHLIIIKAIKLLKDDGANPCVVFTGRQHDWRNPEYFPELTNLVVQYNLSENILFLGLIDRAEQLLLMKNAIAIIQPSRFEGWSTVIEDAKAMNQMVIASNIAVHMEQMNENAIFFDPDNWDELASIIGKLMKFKPPLIVKDYNLKVLKYANDFMDILKN